MQLKLTYLVNLDLVKSHHQNLHTLLSSTAMKVGMMLSIDTGSMGFISIMKEHYSITEFSLLLLNVLFYESILALLDLF